MYLGIVQMTITRRDLTFRAILCHTGADVRKDLSVDFELQQELVSIPAWRCQSSKPHSASGGGTMRIIGPQYLLSWVCRLLFPAYAKLTRLMCSLMSCISIRQDSARCVVEYVMPLSMSSSLTREAAHFSLHALLLPRFLHYLLVLSCIPHLLIYRSPDITGNMAPMALWPSSR